MPVTGESAFFDACKVHVDFSESVTQHFSQMAKPFVR